MTPLLRWVLLALLLVVAFAQPDAQYFPCGCLCRVRTRIPKIAAVCDQPWTRVPQQRGDWYLLLRIATLCLVPYSDPESPNHPLFHEYDMCQSVWEKFIEANSCTCDTSNNGKAEDLEEQQQYMYKISEDAVAAPADAEDQQGRRSTDPPEDKLKISVVEDRLNSIDADPCKRKTDSTEHSIGLDL